ncbi:MAG TPA: metallophosphoesterase [Nevskiaceae bacterium]|nr:metallophosphoesterase [Nevskiaceae bacterium]
MRILLTSDLHYNLRQYDWIIQAASAFDAVAIAGDHLDASLPVPSHVQIAALRASFQAIAANAPLMVCSGNHDLNSRNAAGEMTAGWLTESPLPRVAVDGDSIEVRDHLFTVCPWWEGPATQAEVEQLLAAAAARRRGPWIWIYHAPPHGPLSWNGRRHLGDSLLPTLIERHRPYAVLCGHIHEAPFYEAGSWVERLGETWLFNAGHQPGDVPARVEIDLGKGRARWITSEGEEAQAL